MSGNSLGRPEPGMAFMRWIDAVDKAWRNCDPACDECEFLRTDETGESCAMLHAPTIPDGQCLALKRGGNVY